MSFPINSKPRISEPFPIIPTLYLDRCWVQKKKNKRKPRRFFVFSTWPWNFDARHPKRMLPKKIILMALELWLTICTFDWPRGDSNIIPWAYKIPLYIFLNIYILYGPCKSINCKNSAKCSEFTWNLTTSTFGHFPFGSFVLLAKRSRKLANAESRFLDHRTNSSALNPNMAHTYQWKRRSCSIAKTAFWHKVP